MEMKMDKETDAKLFAAALYVITNMWSKEMDTMQRASLANQIVREIERRGVIGLIERPEETAKEELPNCVWRDAETPFADNH
jgi:predicted outer membrane lipoprotein